MSDPFFFNGISDNPNINAIQIGVQAQQSKAEEGKIKSINGAYQGYFPLKTDNATNMPNTYRMETSCRNDLISRTGRLPKEKAITLPSQYGIARNFNHPVFPRPQNGKLLIPTHNQFVDRKNPLGVPK